MAVVGAAYAEMRRCERGSVRIARHLARGTGNWPIASGGSLVRVTSYVELTSFAAAVGGGLAVSAGLFAAGFGRRANKREPSYESLIQGTATTKPMIRRLSAAL